ncbi:MAG: S49 family peptidase [Polynucleobacter victoriensis]|jgi:protease IV|uniref:Protease-4 n=1 Tax=Polynucleobacter victoriensis TaxID=2049319 RepID=A0A212T468_9BURK|nr:S49 family peptidase [Polynucleobacter victoriensis]SNC60843.1 protease-4 [Polynucleobacter victoriensis]
MSDEKVWERQALEHLLLENLKEQRRGRRWRTAVRLMTLVVFVGVAINLFDLDWGGKSALGKHTALVDLQGEIAPDSKASADAINASLKAAFESHESVGVILRINSPGGSPVQSGIIHDEILRLRAKYPEKPLHVVVEEICASGGYYVAVAGDKIFVDKASLVGSVGVIMNGFGVTGLMDKLGIERRAITAGKNKALLDPFSKEDPKQKAFVQEMLSEVHQQFIKVVRDGRGDRLKETPEMFSGLVWNGAKSVELGLTDALGTVDGVAREVFKAPEVVDYTMKDNLAERVAKRFGAAMGESVAKVMSSPRLN